MTMYLLAGLLSLGLLSNALIRPVAAIHHVPNAESAVASDGAGSAPALDAGLDRRGPSSKTMLAWLVVGIPLTWGIVETVKKSLALFL